MSVKQKSMVKYAGGLLIVIMICLIPLLSYADETTEQSATSQTTPVGPGITEENLAEEAVAAAITETSVVEETQPAQTDASAEPAATTTEAAPETTAAAEPAPVEETPAATVETAPESPAATEAAPVQEAAPETTAAMETPATEEAAVTATDAPATMETTAGEEAPTTEEPETTADTDAAAETTVISEEEEMQTGRRTRGVPAGGNEPNAQLASGTSSDAGITETAAGSSARQAEQPETQATGNTVKGKLEDQPSTLTATGSDTIVEAYGMGASREHALQAALMEAIAKVNGTTLTNTQVEQLRYQLDAVLAVSGSSSKTGEIAGQENLQYGIANQVDFITNGMVKSYEVISEGRINKEYEISIRAVVAKYTPGVEAQRQRIAVMPFRILNASGMQALYAEFFTQHLVDYLAQTNRFAVVDRKYMAEKHAEFAILNSADTPVAERMRIGNTLGADYMVTGQINKVEYWLTEEKLPYLNSMQYTLTAKTSFNVRVIVPATGLVVTSKTYDEKTELKFDGCEGLKLEDVEQAEIDKLAAAAGKKVGENITQEVYPVMAIAYSPDGVFTINQGGDTIKAGQQFNVRVYGEMLVDPYTKEELGRSEKTIGMMEITEVMPRFAFAKVLELNSMADINALVTQNNIILRPVAPKAPEKTPPPPAKNQPKW